MSAQSEYCEICGYPYDEDGRCKCSSLCPCGCNNDPSICVYGKNEVNDDGLSDEDWNAMYGRYLNKEE